MDLHHPLASTSSESDTCLTLSATKISPTQKVAVLGSGLYGRALVARLTAAHVYDVAHGSRTPGAAQLPLDAAVANASVIFLAVPASAHGSVLDAIAPSLARGAVLVDISNRPLSSHAAGASNAEKLSKIVPEGVQVVKAFNNLASYDLDGGGTGVKVSKRMPVVHMAGDKGAMDVLGGIVSVMGMVPVNHGALVAARELEAMPHRLFPTWRSSIVVGGIVFAWWLLYATLSTYVIHGRRGEPSRPLSKYPLSAFMASTGETAMTIFALTFLAGPLALIAQVARGNASAPFGKLFGHWLGMRKELGIVAFVFMAAHGIAGAVSASHLDDGWKGGAYFVAGIISFIGFSTLAASSDASVSAAMSWSEFRAVFGFLGAASLAVGVVHQGLWGFIIKKHVPSPASWVGGGKVMPIYWLGIILPMFTLLMRAISWSPFITLPQRKLRGEIEGPRVED